MSYQTVLLDRKDGIATITFHRPEALNAINERPNPPAMLGRME